MKLGVFAVYDTKVKAFQQPVYFQTEAAAVRAFTNTVNDPTSAWNKNPEDFVFHHLGHWDDATGLFSLLTDPVSLATALAVKKEI